MSRTLKPQPRGPQPLRWRAQRLLFSLAPLLLLLLVAPSASAQQQSAGNQQPPASKTGTESTRTGSITGRILADDGRPIANATVFVIGLGGAVPRTGISTDADGRFQVKDLRPGSYSIMPSAPGYVLTPDAWTETGMPRYYRLGESVQFTMMKGGVITGTVTNANGEAVVAASVRAVRVRKLSERQNVAFQFVGGRMTDDRGVYRIFGLEPGVYVVAVGGSGQTYGILSAYEGEAPTYYPSATRETAAELTVHASEELTGIDVRYRNERGHTISGIISGVAADAGPRFSGISISLLRAGSGTQESFTFVNSETRRTFALEGIADGDYTLLALHQINNESLMATRKISVRGADVGGVELKLEMLGTLNGNVVLEPLPKGACENRPDVRGALLEEIIIIPRRGEDAKEDNAIPPFLRRTPTAPNDKGEFKLQNLRGGSYRLDVQVPGDDWYVRSIAMPAPPAAKGAAQSKPTTPGTFNLKAGERAAGLTVTVAQGAAGLRGRVATATEGADLPARLRVHLVPVEPERAADVLRYSEAPVESEGRFALDHLAPGRYWLIARPEQSDETAEQRRAVALDASARDKLRREAEAASIQVELQPCQRLADYVLNYGPTPPKPAPAK